MKRVITTEDIRRSVTALPEVTETSHFRFKVPVFQVAGNTFLGMGRHEDTAIFCIPEAAEAAAKANPDTYLQVRLGSLDSARAKELIEQAWRNQAPNALRRDRRQRRKFKRA